MKHAGRRSDRHPLNDLPGGGRSGQLPPHVLPILAGRGPADFAVQQPAEEWDRSHFETGTRQQASADNLVKLATALSVSVDYLLGRTNQMELRDDRVRATFRHLSDASADTID